MPATRRGSTRDFNYRRPWRKCPVCRDFNGFTDARGLNPGNPYCECNLLARLQVKGRKNGYGLNELFFTCQVKRCGFYEEWRYGDGRVVGLGDGDVWGMVGRGEC